MLAEGCQMPKEAGQMFTEVCRASPKACQVAAKACQRSLFVPGRCVGGLAEGSVTSGCVGDDSGDGI